LPVGHLLSNQCSRSFCFHEAAIAPAFHSRELRGELRLQAIKMAGCHVCRIQLGSLAALVPAASGPRGCGRFWPPSRQVARPAPEFCNRVNVGWAITALGTIVALMLAHIQRGQVWGSRGSHGPRHSRRSAVSTLGRPDTLTTLAETKVSTGNRCAEDQGVTLHSLRLTHASQLIASGMDVLTISCRLGHASPCYHLDSVWLPDRRQRPTGSRGHGT